MKKLTLMTSLILGSLIAMPQADAMMKGPAGGGAGGPGKGGNPNQGGGGQKAPVVTPKAVAGFDRASQMSLQDLRSLKGALENRNNADQATRDAAKQYLTANGFANVANYTGPFQIVDQAALDAMGDTITLMGSRTASSTAALAQNYRVIDAMLTANRQREDAYRAKNPAAPAPAAGGQAGGNPTQSGAGQTQPTYSQLPASRFDQLSHMTDDNLTDMRDALNVAFGGGKTSNAQMMKAFHFLSDNGFVNMLENRSALTTQGLPELLSSLDNVISSRTSQGSSSASALAKDRRVVDDFLKANYARESKYLDDKKNEDLTKGPKKK